MEAAKAIFWEFALYQNGNGAIIYEQHWGDFPSNSFFRLEQLLGVDVRNGNCD